MRLCYIIWKRAEGPIYTSLGQRPREAVIYCARAESPPHKLLWIGPSALPFLPGIILGRCPRLVWYALTALVAKQFPQNFKGVKKQSLPNIKNWNLLLFYAL
jgi:hypothetical protein